MKDIINHLQLLDIPRREAEVYLALLQKKFFSAAEIAKITTVNRTKIYEVLQSLVRKGFCNETIKNGNKFYSSVNPQIVFKNILADYEGKRKVADKLSLELTKLYDKKDMDSNKLDYIEVMTDLGQIRNKWIQLQALTKYEMLGFNKSPHSMPDKENMKHQAKMMKKKKIISRGIYEIAELYAGTNPTEFLPAFEFYESLGEECRVIEKLPMKMMIMDEKITMLALNDPVSMQPSITTIIIDHPSFAQAQKEVFEVHWAKALTLKEFKKLKLGKYFYK